MNELFDYWNVKPPYKAGDYLEGSKEWSEAITANLNAIIPYHFGFLEAKRYSNKKVLEIGCGSGSDTIALAKAGAAVTALDISMAAVSMTSNRLRAEGIDGVEVVKYRGIDLKGFDDDSFDCVYSCGVLHHTPYMDDLIVEAYRVLKKGGHLKLMVYNKESVLYYYSIVYLRKYKMNSELSREELLSKYSEFREGCPYTKCLTIGELVSRLPFSRVEVWPDYPVYDTLEDRKISIDGNFDAPKETGIIDLDQFFVRYNEDTKRGKYSKEYGWHLLAEATK